MAKKKGYSNKKRKGPAVRKRKAKRKITVGPLWIAVVLVVLFGILSIPYLKRTFMETGADVPELALSGGEFTIDVSHFQKTICWDSLVVMVDAKGRTTRDITRAKHIKPVASAIIKATEGETMVDPSFKEYWETAGASRVRRGAYHFYRSSRNPEKQSRNFIETVGPLRYSDLPPVLDVETLHKGGSKKALNDGIRTWLKIVGDAYGCKPIIYSSENFLKEVIAPDITAEYPVWVAHYGVEKPVRTGWKGWQFTDRAVVYGADGKVDLSVFNLMNINKSN